MVTVGIKALNEEARIAAALEHALRAVAPFDGVVVLADSGSTDWTLEIASKYPVRVVQLADHSQRCCGAGAQLAFQHVDTEFFYLQDADMELDATFLPEAIDFLRANAQVAGVGGHVNERIVEGEEFQIRVRSAHAESHRRPGFVDRLDGGGLYRVEAIRQIGYFADRNLHAFEEFDLAARLESAGWRLARLDRTAVDHFGHTIGGYTLMRRRIRSGYTRGAGEVLRAALGQAHFGVVVRRLSHLRNATAVICWWVLLVLSGIWQPLALVPLVLVPVAFLAYRRGSLRLGIYSFTYWNVGAWGLLSGLLRRRVHPREPLGARVITGAGGLS